MKNMRFTVLGQLPTLNEYIKANNATFYRSNGLKQRSMELVELQLKRLNPYDKPANYTFTWYRPNKKSDPDNVSFGAKIVFDALQTTGRLPNDSMKYVKSISHKFKKGDYAVVVEIDFVD